MSVTARLPAVDAGAGYKDLVSLYVRTETVLQSTIRTAVLQHADGTAAFQRLQLLRVQAELARLQRAAIPLARQTVAAAYLGAAHAVDVVNAADLPAWAGVNQHAMNRLAASLASPLQKITMTVGRQAADVYRQAGLLESGIGIAAGRTRAETAAAIAGRLSRRGVTGFVDKSGRRWRMSVYASMVARTTTREAVAQGTYDRMGAHGLDLVTVDGGNPECEICGEYQGQTYSVSGQSVDYDELPDGGPPFHPQCACSATPADVEFSDWLGALDGTDGGGGGGGGDVTATTDPAAVDVTPASTLGTDVIIQSLDGAIGEDARSLLDFGHAIDTKRFYTDSQGMYTAEREQLHRQIIEKLTADARPQEDPQALFTAGGAASGKSGLAGAADVADRNLLVPDSAVRINPDDIKPLLPEYRQLADGGRQDVAAAASHEESSDIAKSLAALSTDRKYNMIIDGVGNSKIGKFGDKIRAAIGNGYQVEVRYAHVDVETALEREAARAAETGRKVGEETLRGQHASVSQNYFNDVKNIQGARVSIYDTTVSPPRLIADKAAGATEVTVIDPGTYAEVLVKMGPDAVVP